MGGAEEPLRQYWQAGAQQVLPTVYNNDVQKIAPVIERAWRSLIRAHLHAGAIGTAAVALIYVLSRLNVTERYKQTNAIFLGFGAMGYSFSWLYAAFKVPLVGNMAVAKESIHYLAVLSVGMLLVGLIAVLGPVIKGLFSKEA